MIATVTATVQCSPADGRRQDALRVESACGALAAVPGDSMLCLVQHAMQHHQGRPSSRLLQCIISRCSALPSFCAYMARARPDGGRDMYHSTHWTAVKVRSAAFDLPSYCSVLMSCMPHCKPKVGKASERASGCRPHVDARL